MVEVNDWVQDWDSGKEKAVAKLQGGDDVKQVLYGLCAATSTGQLPSDKLIEVLTESECVARVPDLSSNLADIFWMLNVIAESQTDPAAAKSALSEIVKSALSEGWVTADVLKARCESDLLKSAGVVPDAKQFDSKVVKIKTQLMFTQKKFNLLREESEGYSKVVTELCQGKSGFTLLNASAIFEHIQALIGYFDLDPNRCFDLVLEAFEQDLNNSAAFLSLISRFNPSHACVSQIVGFKFQMYADISDETPSTLYRLAAVLTREGLLRNEDIYVHLSPTDVVAKQLEAARKTAMETAAKGIGVVNLADTGKEVRTSARGVDPPKSVPKMAKEVENQKLGMLDALLSEGDFASAELLFKRIAFMRPASHPSVAKGLCSQLHDLFDPLYASTPICQALRNTPPTAKAAKKEKAREADGDSDAATDDVWAVIGQQAVPLLRYLSIHISKDIPLFVKICRTLQHHYGEAEKMDDAALNSVEQIIKIALMPALALVPTNPGLGSELWSVVSLLPYSHRFQIYGHLKTVGYVEIPELILRKAETKDESKKVMQRISNETVKQQGRALGKLSHSNPIVVFERVVDNVRMMPNIITALVDSLRYITSLSFDVLTFMLIEALSDPTRTRLKDDGANMADWLTSLSSLAGSMSRKYASVELAALLKYVAQQLISGSLPDLIILRDLVGSMTGHEAIEDLTDVQLRGQTGGPLLRAETNPATGGAVKATQRTTRRLKDAMVDSKLMVPTIILLGQQTSSCLYNNEHRQLKVIGETYDKTHESLLQLVTFLSTTVAPATYAQDLPKLRELISKHHMQPEAAFHISRTVLESTYGGHEGIVTAVEELLPVSTWECISPQLYATFWSLSLYDIDVPKQIYSDQLSKLQQQVTKIENDRSLRETAAKKAKKEKTQVIEKISAELKAQQQHATQMLVRLRKEAPTWMTKQAVTKSPDQAEGLNIFTQCCIFPRVLFSQLDSAYCAKFVLKMHELKTPNFSVLLYYDKVVKLIAPAVSCCTRNEATRLGRFLAETLKLLEHWKSEASVYRKECQDHPGFKKSFTDQNAQAITYNDFVKVNHKWHTRLLKTFSTGLTREYTEQRNCFVVLQAILPHFPAIKKHYSQIEAKVRLGHAIIGKSCS
jgi:THO complex subunit 2